MNNGTMYLVNASLILLVIRQIREHPLDARSLMAPVLAVGAVAVSNAEIGQRLYLTNATVKTHINRIFAKTGARDRAQAVRYAYQHGRATRLNDTALGTVALLPGCQVGSRSCLKQLRGHLSR